MIARGNRHHAPARTAVQTAGADHKDAWALIEMGRDGTLEYENIRTKLVSLKLTLAPH